MFKGDERVGEVYVYVEGREGTCAGVDWGVEEMWKAWNGKLRDVRVGEDVCGERGERCGRDVREV